MDRNPTHEVITFPVLPQAFLALLGERFKPETQLFNIDKKYGVEIFGRSCPVLVLYIEHSFCISSLMALIDIP